jgi:hypothetical protein
MQGGAPAAKPLKTHGKIVLAKIRMSCDKRITEKEHNMTTTEIKYQLFCVTGPNEGYQAWQLFDSEMLAKNHALSLKDDTDREYQIRSIITTTSTVEIFTIPAHVPTLEEIAQEIIEGSDGSFYVEWGDDFEKLDKPDRSKVEEMVWDEIASCEDCGWHFHVESLEQHIDSGDNLCWKCANDREEAESEEEEDEDNED